MVVEVGDDDVLVRPPAASGHEGLLPCFESFHKRQFLCLFPYVKHAVKTCVAYDCHIALDANSCEEVGRLLVLHEEVCDAPSECVGIALAIPAEEYLLRTEDAAYGIYGNVIVVACHEEVAPELILYQEQCHGAYEGKEAEHIALRV